MQSIWKLILWLWHELTAKKVYGKVNRSSKWPALRRTILDINKKCAVCGRKEKLEVHHIIPFNVRPDLELEPTNLIVLCADPCHFVFGHLYNWSRYNKAVIKDAMEWKEKIEQAK